MLSVTRRLNDSLHIFFFWYVSMLCLGDDGVIVWGMADPGGVLRQVHWKKVRILYFYTALSETSPVSGLMKQQRGAINNSFLKYLCVFVQLF